MHSICLISQQAATLPILALEMSTVTDTPGGYLTCYYGPICLTGGGGSTASLPLDVCVSNLFFSSFQGTLSDGCPEGKTATITAYAGPGCDGPSTTAGELPEGQNPGACVDYPGQSAKFTCEQED